MNNIKDLVFLLWESQVDIITVQRENKSHKFLRNSKQKDFFFCPHNGEASQWKLYWKICYCSIVGSWVWLFATPWTTAGQAPLSTTISQSLLKFMSIESVTLSNHLILCHPLLLLPSTFSASGSLPMSWLFASGGQSSGASSFQRQSFQWIFRVDIDCFDWL